MRKVGRPKSKVRKIMTTVGIEPDIMEWLDMKGNKSDVINFSLRKQMIKEMPNRLEELKIQLRQMKIERDKVQLELEIIGTACSELANIVNYAEKEGTEKILSPVIENDRTGQEEADA